MKYAIPGQPPQVKPISQLQANAVEIIRQLGEQREPVVITQNGEATAVIQDIRSYEETQETLALLKMLALGNRQVDEGQVEEATTLLARLRTSKSCALDAEAALLAAMANDPAIQTELGHIEREFAGTANDGLGDDGD